MDMRQSDRQWHESVRWRETVRWSGSDRAQEYVRSGREVWADVEHAERNVRTRAGGLSAVESFDVGDGWAVVVYQDGRHTRYERYPER